MMLLFLVHFAASATFYEAAQLILIIVTAMTLEQASSTFQQYNNVFCELADVESVRKNLFLFECWYSSHSHQLPPWHH